MENANENIGICIMGYHLDCHCDCNGKSIWWILRLSHDCLLMLKTDIDELEVGDWCFLNGTKMIAIRLLEHPDRGYCILPIAREGEAPEGTHWEWNGSIMEPSLKPSILHWADGKNKAATWHGYLTEGKLVKADDSPGKRQGG